MSRRIAPLLASRRPRQTYSGRLPPSIKAAIKLLAHHEGKSMSWLLEETLIDAFKLKRPTYRDPKGPK